MIKLYYLCKNLLLYFNNNKLMSYELLYLMNNEKYN
jgi:hypothetical protein